MTWITCVMMKCGPLSQIHFLKEAVFLLWTMCWIELNPNIKHNLVPVPKLGTSINCQQLRQYLDT